jgi:hypothetical protein
MALAGVAALGAQGKRDSLITRAKEEFDAARRIQLLVTALDPTLGPLRGAWEEGVQLLAQSLIDDERDTDAAVWLRWAVRLAPAMQADTVQFPPQVTTALQAARQFVNQTRTPADTATTTTWEWPAGGIDRGPARIQVGAVGGAPLQVSVDGGAVLGPGGSLQVAPGSHSVVATAAGHDSVRVTIEALPATTTVVRFWVHARPVAERQQAAGPVHLAAPARHRRFPWVLAVVGAAGAGTAIVLLAGKKEPQRATGGITITFPNP